MSQDEDQLRLLSIFHYVVGGLAGMFALFPVIHLVIGLMIVFAPQSFPGRPGDLPPAIFGWLFVGMAAMAILVGLAMAASIVLAGRFLTRRTHYTYCLVIAGIECMFMPFGTVLGVFTIVVLMRESVKSLFHESPPKEPWLTEAADPTDPVA